MPWSVIFLIFLSNLVDLCCPLSPECCLLKVHITQGDYEGNAVIISWITPDEPGSNTVLYWAENGKHKSHANGIVLTYKYFKYTSGYIHHCTIRNLVVRASFYLTTFNKFSWFVGSHLKFNRMELNNWITINAVWYKILLWGWDWEYYTTVLVCNSSQSWPWCSLYFWSHRYFSFSSICSACIFDHCSLELNFGS